MKVRTPCTCHAAVCDRTTLTVSRLRAIHLGSWKQGPVPAGVALTSQAGVHTLKSKPFNPVKIPHTYEVTVWGKGCHHGGPVAT